MARTKQSGGEASTPLIIALVFFILLSIGLGVMYYMANGEIGGEKAKADEAANKAKASDLAMKKAQDETKLYKQFIGMANPDETAYMANPSNETKDHVRAAHRALLEAVNSKISSAVKSNEGMLAAKGAGFGLPPTEVYTWNWPDAGQLPATPSPLPLMDRLVKVVAERELAVRQTEIETTNAKNELAALSAEKKRYSDTIIEYSKKLDAALKSLSDAKDAVEKDKEAAIAKLNALGEDFRKEKTRVAVAVEEVELQKKKLEEQNAALGARVGRLEARDVELSEQKAGAFPFNPPHGEILRRVGVDKMVDISIGSAANVKPGQTFKVQPASTRTEGLGARRKQTYDQRGNLVVSDELMSKGSVEVVKVLGPNLSTARITEETDEIRDGILKGDLLYNPLFKKGAADHVVLYGIFDIDADGIDDIRDVAQQLQRRGVIVDGYYDLGSRKWESLDPKNTKPGPTQNTTYAVKGWLPDPKSESYVAASMADVLAAIETASKEANAKGIQEIRAIKFFPEIGLTISPKIGDSTVNMAAVKYTRDVPKAADK